MPMTHLDAVLNAAEERDLALLSSAIQGLTDEAGTEGAQAFLRSKVLPQLTLRSLLWLWRTITSPLEQYQLLGLMSDRTSSRLIKQGFVIGKDFSFAEADDGNRHLMLSAEAKKYLELTLKTDSLVSLQLLTRHKHVSN